MTELKTWHKDWMMTFTGRRVYPFEVQASDTDVQDIAHSLGMQVRYNGHVSRLYTVGEHCIRISDALFRDTGDHTLALVGLLHDAGETYTGDFIRPVKNSLHQVEAVLKAAEDNNERAIMHHFGLCEAFERHRATIKDYDRRIIVDEKAALFGPDKPWDWDLVPLDVPIIGYSRKQGMGMYNWDPERVAEEYLIRYHEHSRGALHS
jgi:hypothetical protein